MPSDLCDTRFESYFPEVVELQPMSQAFSLCALRLQGTLVTSSLWVSRAGPQDVKRMRLRNFNGGASDAGLSLLTGPFLFRVSAELSRCKVYKSYSQFLIIHTPDNKFC